MTRFRLAAFAGAWFGGALLGLFALLSWLSRGFIYGHGHLERPIVAAVLVLWAASAVYLLAVRWVLRHPQRVRLASVLLFAAAFRLVLLPANPIQEDDAYRYVWDGQVTLAGLSPYAYAPQTIEDFQRDPDAVSGQAHTDLLRLDGLIHGEAIGPRESARRQDILERINHPTLRTIYPPVAQWALAAGQWLAPWSPKALRVWWLGFDALCIGLLILLLKRLGLPPAQALIYAWSPLVIKEFANSGHLDVLPVTLCVAAALAVLSRRWMVSGALLALAIGSKWFPLALVPAIGWHVRRAGRRPLLRWSLALLAVSAAIFLPAWQRDGRLMLEGLTAYARTWQLNAGLFRLLRAAVGAFAEPDAAWWIARLIAGVGLAIGVLVSSHPYPYRVPKGHVDRSNMSLWNPVRAQTLARACCMAMGLAFLFSPVGDPWYLTWVIPWLCIRPSWPWLGLTALIHAYYLGFYAEYHHPDRAARLWDLIIAVEYVPFALWCAWACRGRKAHQ